MSLKEYRRKRDFKKTPEPEDKGELEPGSRFVVQKHAARRLHYDLRLELDGAFKSWAVPKGPSYDPSVKSLAVQVEDHPLEYGGFEGVIPQGEYGGGTVMIWDRGTWEPQGKAAADYKKGKLRFRLNGEKLKGEWALIRMGGEKGKINWLLKKIDDSTARPADEFDVVEEELDSVASGRSMEQIAADSDRVWTSEGEVARTPTNAKDSESFDVASLPGAQRAPIKKTYQPQLATLVRSVPESGSWIHELKFDGYRLLCRLEKGKALLITRGQQDWTDRFTSVAKAAQKLGVKNAVLDGEVVVLRPDGTTDFQALQNLMNRGRDDDVVYYVFDLLYCNGYSLIDSPLADRKQLLRQLVDTADGSIIRFSEHFEDRGKEFYQHACQHAVEGVVSKRADSRYEEKRSKSWLKVKCLNRQEFVIGGWTEPSGSRSGFGALLVGYFDNDQLVYCGRVGTGFNQESLEQVKQALDQRPAKKPAFDNPPKGSDAKGVHWVAPELVAEVEFAQWTGDGILRHASFQGLREDKEPKAVTREQPKSVSEVATKRRTNSSAKSQSPSKSKPQSQNEPRFGGVKLSNPSRVLYPESGLEKQDLAEYYDAVADYILPHLVDRPLTLVRCPQGREKKCFYQKHLTESVPDPVRAIEVEEKDGTAQYVSIADKSGLITLVQLGVLEIHPWGSRADRLDRPDRLVMDMDPGDGVAWPAIVDAALQMRKLLDDLGLRSFVRSTGGKGLHVVVPLSRRADWSEAKDFAHDLADTFVRREPKKFIATASKAKRKGKIYVDYLRNDKGSTAIASYSTRARPGATVATPLHWEELTDKLDPQQFNIRTVPDRLSSLDEEPWSEMADVRQAITKSIRKQLKSM